jgi:hypothetical protein
MNPTQMKTESSFRWLVPFAGVVAALALLNGCGEHPTADGSGHSHAAGEAHSHAADHAPPHGGTTVLVADDEFHLELVLNPAAAKLQAYVLDGHLERYVQVPETNFVIVASSGGTTERLAFQRAPEPGSGTVPATSALFEARADWLKTAKEFAGSIPTITLNGKTFTNISFPFPKGTQHVH